MDMYDKPEADTIDAFLDSADARGTSVDLLRAIWQVARGPADANRVWEAPTEAEVVAIVEVVTGNGRTETSDYCWGAAGCDWALSAE